MKKILLVLAFFPAIWFVSCREESELSVINTHVTLSVGKTEKISFSGTIKSIESTDRFVASVDGYSVTGEHVGTASIVINSGEYIIPVKISGWYDIYSDPLTAWNCSMDSVENYAKKEWGISSAAESDSSALVYRDFGKSDLMLYLFDDDKLTGVVTALDSQYASEIGDYLSERYYLSFPFDLGSYTFGGMNAYEIGEATTFVYVKVHSSKIIVAYVPARPTTVSDAESLGIMAFEKMEDFLEETVYSLQ